MSHINNLTSPYATNHPYPEIAGSGNVPLIRRDQWRCDCRSRACTSSRRLIGWVVPSSGRVRPHLRGGSWCLSVCHRTDVWRAQRGVILPVRLQATSNGSICVCSIYIAGLERPILSTRIWKPVSTRRSLAQSEVVLGFFYLSGELK